MFYAGAGACPACEGAEVRTHREGEDALAYLDARVPDGRLNEILLGMAQAMWWTSWASAMEEAGRSRELSGHHIDVIAPSAPWWAAEDAQRYWEALLISNADNPLAFRDDGVGLQEAVLRYISDLVADVDTSYNQFGYLTMMQAMGTGIRWTDDHIEHSLRIPHFEERIVDPDELD
jgi:hypothetical protein